MKNLKPLITTLLLLGGTLGVASQASAATYVPQGPFVHPGPGHGIPSRIQVPGKEYSDYLDKNHLGVPNPEQTLLWDGVGGTANGFNYGGSGQVDALANINDALFKELIQNRAALLFSTGQTGIGGGNTLWDDHVLVEPISGGVKIWATPAQIDANGVTDVDGLEVWGPEEIPDANVYSLRGDPGGNSVLFYNSGTGISTPLVTTAQILGAVSPLFPSLTLSLSDIDVDGLVYQNSINRLVFSLAPTGLALNDPTLNLDGGEIFDWVIGTPSASFLNHGGHLWDTVFDVRGYISANIGGNANEISENIDALEVVATTPEPASPLAFLTLGILGFGAILKRKGKNLNPLD